MDILQPRILSLYPPPEGDKGEDGGFMHRICHVSRINKMKFPIQSRYMTKSQDYEHMANLIKVDTDIISQMVDNDHFFE